MRSALSVAGVAVLGLLVSACGHSGMNRVKPDEYAIARQAPLVIPPDYSLVPPAPGAGRPQDSSAADQTLQALFGGPAKRSPAQSGAVDAAGQADPGIRSGVGDPGTTVLNKGGTTRDIVAAPEGDGQTGRVSIP